MNDRASKKQQELLEFIREFIAEHEYGPSYREVMNGLGYKSVSTVAIHINNLIAKGYIRKTGRTARSIEIVKNTEKPSACSEMAWLENRVSTLIESGTLSKEQKETLLSALDMLK